MFKCKILALFIFPVLGVGCVSSKKIDGPLADMTKICGERESLVFQIIPFDVEDFDSSDDKMIMLSDEKTLDLKNGPAKKAGLEWMQLKFKNRKLFSLWYGPRESFESDMEKVGINTYYVRDASGKKTENFVGESFLARDLNKHTMTIEHEGSPIEGVMITCSTLR